MPKLKDLFKKQKPEEQSDKIGNKITRGEYDNTYFQATSPGLDNKDLMEETKEFTLEKLISFMGDDYAQGQPLSADDVMTAIAQRMENTDQLVKLIKEKIVSTDEFIAEQAAEMIRYLNGDKDISEVIQFAFDKSPTSSATQTAAYKIKNVQSKEVQLKLMASAMKHSSRYVSGAVEDLVEGLSRREKSKLDKLVSGK